MAWAITNNIIDDEKWSRVSAEAFEHGVMHNEITQHPLAKKFRVKDDDGEIYFTGSSIIWGDDDERDYLGVLDEFAIGYGCTTVEFYMNEGGKKGWYAIN